MMRASFQDMIQRIEDELAASYGFPIAVSASSCLTQSAEAAAVASENRAALILRTDPVQDELEVGLYFKPDLMATIEQQNPLQRLDSHNLDAFCVAVEEVSHFHLVINRVQAGQGVSLLELEWQGEVDKLLIAGRVLEQQTGDPHLPQLTRMIFDHSYCYTSQQDLYEEAHRLAARYCYKLLPELQSAPSRKRAGKLRDACRQTYELLWAEKLRTINRL
ncbi:MAG TPA: hypothetical protein VFO10_15970 [Oligoflexus sp.]|uniref:hypothetical protein n=1 Tax=Oligoflexus sp. TaxID=1971216 RepID=UPI002D7FDC6B|nr:hypothetical protein [Oligoflexus sp.]HET9238758.1 hypothetical protein [Oligoflexus sp.]